MEPNEIIIICAVLFIVISFTIYFIGIIRIGRKNAIKSNNTVVKLTHGDIFKFETQLHAKMHSKMDKYLNEHEEPFEAMYFGFIDKQPTNKF